jgi:hypothetical protein
VVNTEPRTPNPDGLSVLECDPGVLSRAWFVQHSSTPTLQYSAPGRGHP